MTATKTQALTWRPELTLGVCQTAWEANARSIDQHRSVIDKHEAGSASFWSGSSGDGFRAYLRRNSAQATTLSAVYRRGSEAAGRAASAVASAQTAAKSAIQRAEAQGFLVAEDGTTRPSNAQMRKAGTSGAAQLESIASAHQMGIANALRVLGDADEMAARDISRILTELRPVAKENEGPQFQRTPRELPSYADRAKTSAAAFRNVFGRDPATPADWKTADSLNPNSYDPKYKGVPPEIRVARINPVPGQGVVRTGHLIERDTVYNPPNSDWGDNRGPNAKFDPEHTRVSMYVDYENGLVVMRQNPSRSTNRVGRRPATVRRCLAGG